MKDHRRRRAGKPRLSPSVLDRINPNGIPELFIKLRLTLPLAFGGHRGILMLERPCQP